jgi:acetylglutamate kinase
VGAQKLIYLSDIPGILEGGELISELSRKTLQDKIDSGVITGGMSIKTESIQRALGSGVKAVHLIDGRTPHNVIAELFTDRGVGTLIRD